MKTFSFLKALALIILAVFIPAGCSEEDNKTDKGRITVSITDSPFDFDLVESAEITVSQISVRQKSNADTTPYLVISDQEVTLDIMKLMNGVSRELVTADVPAGIYDRISLIVTSSALKLKSGELFEIKIPGGAKSGIKINIQPSITVESSLSSDVMLDFDLSRSFVLKGNPVKPDKINGFTFKPVIRAVNLTAAGTIEGKVTDINLNPLTGALVSLKKDSVIATAFTGNEGKYVIPAVLPGTYSLYAKKEKYDSLLFEGVKVISGNTTIRNFALKLQ